MLQVSDLDTGEQVVEYHKNMRRERAKLLLLHRSIIRKTYEGYIKPRNDLAKALANRQIHERIVPFKPTRDNFLKAAKQRYGYSRSEVFSLATDDEFEILTAQRKCAEMEAREYIRAMAYIDGIGK